MLVITPVLIACGHIHLATFLQISKTPMILMTDHLIRIRQITLSANSNSPILAPQNGMCFTFFAPVRPWRLAMRSVTLHAVMLRSFL